MNNELIKPAMEILTFAGDARLSAKNALLAVQKQDFSEARKCLDEAKKEIVKAHSAQTKIIQDEARGKEYEYCMLFNHAQDTLMTINSEVELVSSLIDTFEVYTHLMNGDRE